MSIGSESTKVEVEVAVMAKIDLGPGTGLMVGTVTSTIIEEEEIILAIEITEIIGPITEIVVGLETETTIEMGIGTITDQTTKGIVMTRGIETEV